MTNTSVPAKPQSEVLQFRETANVFARLMMVTQGIIPGESRHIEKKKLKEMLRILEESGISPDVASTLFTRASNHFSRLASVKNPSDKKEESK